MLLVIRPAASFADWKGQGDSHGASHSAGQSSTQSTPHSSAHSSAQHSGSNFNHRAGHASEHRRGHDYAYSTLDINLAVLPAGYYDDAPYYPVEDIVPVSSLMPGTPPVIVVEPPAPVNVLQPVITPVTVDTQDSYTVNIPNDKGGYTPVILKRSGEGFVGPQGEYYPKFPKVSQLILMYGKA
jgi:hypothetical protein